MIATTALPKTMRAAVVVSFDRPWQIQDDIPVPIPNRNQILVKMIACGVCYSDLTFGRGDSPRKPALPIILGHEGVGEVVQFGGDEEQQTTPLKLGDIVSVPILHSTCLNCEYCCTNREQWCPSLVYNGVHINGAFAEYCLMDPRFSIKLPLEMDPYDSCPLFCAGITTYRALKVSNGIAGDWVAFFGIGGLGSVGIRFAKAMGMKVLAIVEENDEKSKNLAEECGADMIYSGPQQGQGEWIKNNKNIGTGLSVAICTANSEQVYPQALSALKNCGTLVAVIGPSVVRIFGKFQGLPKGSFTIPLYDTVIRGISIVSTKIGSRQDMREMLELAKQNKIKCKVERRKLDDINEVLDDLQQSRIAGRVVIDFTMK